METRHINLENDYHESNYRCVALEIDTGSYLLKSHIQENLAQNDLNERLLHILKRCQMIKTSIKVDVSEFQEMSELKSKVNPIAYYDIEKDQSAENLTTIL
eukprot:TRINITY_DN10874_c3_g1_i1.p1 TRINITY_DN10874_c3_g1~~TRINITY_DN10874_c3_g1_i1.p1  ORF type:complete len:101 (+),score=12.89 TRINITY_DN10874_c3_g1_i1:485-787(+)